MGLDGTNFAAAERTNKAYDLDVVGIDFSDDVLYHIWLEDDDDAYAQIWTGTLS